MKVLVFGKKMFKLYGYLMFGCDVCKNSNIYNNLYFVVFYCDIKGGFVVMWFVNLYRVYIYKDLVFFCFVFIF